MIAASSEYCEYYREIPLTPTFTKQILGTACVTTYYCSLIALSIYYLVVSCYPVLPWTVCHDHLQGAEQGAEQGATNICIPSGANMSDYVTCYHPNQTRPVHR